MEKLSLTALRKRLYQVVDRILDTGIPVVIERHGKALVIAPVEPGSGKLARLERRHGILGDPEDLVALEVAEWHEPPDLR